MRRRRGDDDSKTFPHKRPLEARGEGSADAIFRSFVQRSSGTTGALPAMTDSQAAAVIEADKTPAEGTDLGDATDPRIPARWAETVEMLLEQGLSEVQADASEEGVLLLTNRKSSTVETVRPPAPVDHDRTVAMQAGHLAERLRAAGPKTAPPPAEPSAKPEEAWQSVVRSPSEITQRREALRLVPDVAQVEVPEPPPHERSEDGQIPSGELDRKLSDMGVLLRYGHELQARREIEHLRSRFPQDLLLARRIAEFYLSNERPALALEQLFSLATGLFERRNVEGMRQALEQVLVVDPDNERATRLLALLDQRPSHPPAGHKHR